MMKKLFFLVTFVFIFAPDGDACTAFYASNAGMILVGNNEDWWNPKTRMWFISSEENKFGRVYFGFDDFWPQGGLNEHGLFFDGFATLPLPITRSTNKPVYKGNLIDKIMSECATIDEVLKVLDQYNLQFLETAMLMFGDSEGQSVIIEGDGIIRKKGSYQIVTNFHQSLSKPEEFTCWRYNQAERFLKDNQDISVELFRTILDAVHQDGTQYSNIYDLKNKIIYLYHFHNFEHVVKIDLMEEIKKGNHSYDLPSLFPRNDKFIMAFYSKLTPNNNTPMLAVVLICSLISCSILFLLPLNHIFKLLKVEKCKYPIQRHEFNRYPWIIYSVATVIALLNVFYLIVLSNFSFDTVIHIINIAMPRSLVNITRLQKGILHIPALLILPTFVLILLTFILWKNRYGSKSERIYFMALSFSSFIFLMLYIYWEIIIF